MTDEQKSNDASRYLVVSMDADQYRVVKILDNEGDARKAAEAGAEKEEGAIFGVFQKVGTARLTRKIEWKGAAG